MNKQKVPKLRFKGFSDDWEQRKFPEFVEFYNGLTYTPGDVQESGTLVLRSSNVKNGEIADADNVYVNPEISTSENVRKGDIIVVVRNGSRALIGKHAEIKESMPNTVIGAFMTGIRSEHSSFVNALLGTAQFEKEIEKNMGATINQITGYMFSKMEFMTPGDEEQEAIGKYFKELDNLITLHQRKLEKLKIIKKSMLENCFPKNGEKIPKFRFDGFSGDWEQRKFSELVTIERGGSPRPIDKFITKDKNGLNWVKIGDAPEQGNYITQTAEKIKPEGLSKTREVHPEDLILSNSMSFGRPYIMAIDGCIHDGWLAIRDTQKNFDLKFLCILLGTDNMLSQYKAMAAGSTVNNLNKELVGGTSVSYPSMNEQIKLGEYFDSLDNLITLHQRKLEKLKVVKKSMLESMFV